MIRKVSRFHSSAFLREKVPSPWAVCASVCTYFFGALALSAIDRGFLLAAWLTTGPLLYAVYLTRDAGGGLVNPYTLFFTGLVMFNLCGYVATALV